MDTMGASKPDKGQFLGILGVIACLFVPVLQANGVDVNWQISAVIYLALISVTLWSLLSHAIPHFSNWMRSLVAVVLFLCMGGLGFYATHKEYRREHKISVVVPQTAVSETTPQVTFPDVSKTPADPSIKPIFRSKLLNKVEVAPALPKERESTPDQAIALSVTILNPHSPSIAMENLSDSLARDVTWELVMFRVRDGAVFSFSTQSFSYVKAKSKTALYAMNLTTLPKADNGDKQISDGDVLIGSLAVDCLTCKGNTYFVYLDWNNNGWISQVKNDHGGLVLPLDVTGASIEKYFNAITSTVKPEDRQVMTTSQQL